jgi:hypothetical protein
MLTAVPGCEILSLGLYLDAESGTSYQVLVEDDDILICDGLVRAPEFRFLTCSSDGKEGSDCHEAGSKCQGKNH